jgi:hypothetical protein
MGYSVLNCMRHLAVYSGYCLRDARAADSKSTGTASTRRRAQLGEYSSAVCKIAQASVFWMLILTPRRTIKDL